MNDWKGDLLFESSKAFLEVEWGAEVVSDFVVTHFAISTVAMWTRGDREGCENRMVGRMDGLKFCTVCVLLMACFVWDHGLSMSALA